MLTLISNEILKEIIKPKPVMMDVGFINSDILKAVIRVMQFQWLYIMICIVNVHRTICSSVEELHHITRSYI